MIIYTEKEMVLIFYFRLFCILTAFDNKIKGAKKDPSWMNQRRSILEKKIMSKSW